MEKKTIIGIFSVIIILLILITWTITSNSKEVEFEQEIEDEIYDEFSHINEPHWTMMPITYKIVNCTDYQENRIIKAFNQIQKETEGIVSFKEYYGDSEYGSDFMIYCYEEYDDSYWDPKETTYTVSDCYYETWENYPNKILYADINFYGITETTYSGGCTIYPDIELHEILHGFGFEHVNETNHIMNPLHTYCPSKLNEDILNKLIEIYSK